MPFTPNALASQMFPGQWERRDDAAREQMGKPSDRSLESPVPADARAAAAIDRDRNDIVPGRREPPTWFKVSFGAAMLFAAMLLVMWAQRPAACALSFEAPRQLQLGRSVDREHLAADSASATRTARRYAPGPASSQRQQRFAECEARLVGEIAATHGVSVDQVRASAGYAQ